MHYKNMHSLLHTYTYNLFSIVNFMLPPSIDFAIFIPPDAYNFGTLGAPLTPWRGGGGGGVTHIFLIFF